MLRFPSPAFGKPCIRNTAPQIGSPIITAVLTGPVHLVRFRNVLLGLALFAAALVVSVAPGHATAAQPDQPDFSGLWDAAVDVGSMHVPFRFGISARDGKAAGWFFNGDDRVVSTTGTQEADHLVLEFGTYARRLDVTLATDGTLSGTYLPTTPGSKALTYPFHAQRATTARRSTADQAPSIGGLWLIPTQSTKANEKAWRLIVRQSGANVSAAILRVDGDSGALTGKWQAGKLLLSHFDGARPSAVEVTPGANHTLQLVVRDTHGADVTLTAYRASDAQANGLPDAADPAHHTTVRDPNEPFQFSFPDLDGHTVSSTDSRFTGKVLVVDIGGSWCPNCHDEAPLLEDLYRKYRARGLEVVTLSFEEPEQFVNPFRLKAFVRDFGLDYTVLLAGTTQNLHEKLPQAVNLDAYPTTFFIGRDGRVRAIHAGFAARVTGEFNSRLKKEFTGQIESLLAEKAPTRSARTDRTTGGDSGTSNL